MNGTALSSAFTSSALLLDFENQKASPTPKATSVAVPNANSRQCRGRILGTLTSLSVCCAGEPRPFSDTTADAEEEAGEPFETGAMNR